MGIGKKESDFITNRSNTEVLFIKEFLIIFE